MMRRKVRSRPPAHLPLVAAPALSGEYAEWIGQALATEGGHLALGRGGTTLYFKGGWLSGCREEVVKAEAIAAGLPVIDSRAMPLDAVWNLAVRGPMVAVGDPPSELPYHAVQPPLGGPCKMLVQHGNGRLI
jgi:hypothetical protein